MDVQQVNEVESFNVEIVWRGPAMLGEGPLWHPQEQKLYWLDCIKPELHQFDPNTKEKKGWLLPAKIGSIAPREAGGLVAAIGTGVAFINITNDGQVKVEPQVEVITKESRLRLNDGKCDRQGRFWFGTVAPDFSNPTGMLYRLDADKKVTEMVQGIKVSNGLGWSPDNKHMYYTDSLQHKIFRYDFDTTTGGISNQIVFANIPESEGVPDGLTVDAEGCVWSAQWNGWRVTRYRPDGSIDKVIKMPAQRPTSCMFGGKDLDILYVTSASQDVGEDHPLPGDLDGVLFAIRVGTKGFPEPAYRG